MVPRPRRALAPYLPYARMAQAGLKTVLKLRQHQKQRVAAKSRYREGGPSTVTNQHDVKRQYKRKRPSRSRTQLTKFAKRIKKAQNLNLPLHTLGEWNNVLIYCIVVSPGPSSQYVLDSSASTNRNDLRLFANAAGGAGFDRFMVELNINSIDSAGTIGGISTSVDNWKFQGQCVMQLALKNIQASAILVDVYECVAAADNVGIYSTAVGAWIQCQSNMQAFDPPAGAASPKLITQNTGTTPFDAAGFAKHWKILNKSRLNMQPTEIISMQFKTKVNTITYARWDGKQTKRGVTKDFIVVACPSYGSDVIAGNLLAVEWTKSYHFRIPDGNKAGVQTSFCLARSY